LLKKGHLRRCPFLSNLLGRLVRVVGRVASLRAINTSLMNKLGMEANLLRAWTWRGES
jgi:hypothetical protein